MNILFHLLNMTETKHVTVRVIRTQSLERNKTNSVRQKNNSQI